MEYEIHTASDELTHWGIKGMRWGIRRYQNKDGSLTPAGKKKLRAEQAKVREQEAVNKKRKSVQDRFDRLEARKKAAEDEKKALDDAERTKLGKSKKDSVDNKGTTEEAKPIKKSVKDMTDEELATAINRARMEDAYRQLRPEVEKHPLMKKMVNEVAIPAVTNAGRQFLQNAITKAGENLLKGKADPNSVEALRKTYDKLDLQNKINKLKNNPEGDTNWDNMLKKQQYEKNERERQKAEQDAADAAKKAKQAEKDAAKKAKQAEKDAAKKAKQDAELADEMKKYQEFQDKYKKSLEPDSSSPYHSKGGEREYVNPSESRSLTVYNSPVSSLSSTSSTVSKGLSTVNSRMNDSVYDLLDRNGNVIVSFGDDD